MAIPIPKNLRSADIKSVANIFNSVIALIHVHEIVYIKVHTFRFTAGLCSVALVESPTDRKFV